MGWEGGELTLRKIIDLRHGVRHFHQYLNSLRVILGGTLGAIGIALCFSAALPFLTANLAYAQDAPAGADGRVRIQGRAVSEDLAPLILDNGPLIDYREEMRRFIQKISSYARGIRPNFAVVVENGGSLTVKTDPADETLVMPASGFTRSIDGILTVGLFHGRNSFGAAPGDEKGLASRLNILDRAKRNGLGVYVLDRADDPKSIDAGKAASAERGFAYHAISTDTLERALLPSHPARPFDESPSSVVSLRDIKNFAVVGNSPAYGRQDEFALRMHQTNYDMLIVDVFHGRDPLTRQAVETLKYKQVGAKRMVLARVDVGVAASYLYYWKNNWQPGSPPWIGAPLHNDPDRYYANFWRPEWQRIIFGDTASYIYGVIDQGYDGVVIAGADIFEIYEGGERAEERLGQ